jgi:monomeric sarcosine oxidase
MPIVWDMSPRVPVGPTQDEVDLAIVGAGLAGAATAWAATRRGLSVALFEQFAVGHDRGSSHGSARIFRRAYEDELYVRLTGESAELWRELEADTATTLLRTTGGVDHGTQPALALIKEYLSAAHVPHEVLDAREAGRRWPGMRFESRVVFHPEAGVIDAEATVRACVDASSRRGALILDRTPVAQIILRDGGVTLRAGEDYWPARRVVVAAGAWVEEVLTGIVPFPRVTVSQQQVFHFPRRDPSVNWPTFVHRHALFVYGLPGGRDGGEQNAQKVAEFDSGTVTTATGRDGIVDPAARSRLVGYVEDWLPGLVPAPLNETTCLYTTTADRDFILDQRGPIIVCSACSGHGAKFAPWLGDQAAKLAAGDGTVEDRFRLDRARIFLANERTGS